MGIYHSPISIPMAIPMPTAALQYINCGCNCGISALNGSGAESQSLVDCDSSTNDALIIVTVVMATLLLVAMAALAVALYKIRVLKLSAAPTA